MRGNIRGPFARDAWQKAIADGAGQRVTDMAKDGDIEGTPHGYIAVNPES